MRKKLVISAAAAAVLAAGTIPALASSGSTSAGTSQFTIAAPTGILTCTTNLDYTATHNPNKLPPTYSIAPLGNVDVNASGSVNYALYDSGALVTYVFCVLI
jgi:hypothetical protein